jgi:hypothetical protein
MTVQEVREDFLHLSSLYLLCYACLHIVVASNCPNNMLKKDY